MKLTLAVLVAALPVFLQAQKLPEDHVRDFFTTYSAGRVEKAIDDLYALSPWMSNKSEDVTQLKSKLVSTLKLVGEYHGYAMLGTEELLSDLVAYDYMVKYDRQPLRFRFLFYRADKDWIIYSFSYDDSLDNELEEAVRLKYYQH